MGDEIVVLPSGANNAREIDRSLAGRQPRSQPRDATAGQSVGITLDDALFVERGNLVSRSDAPPRPETGSARGCSGCIRRRLRLALASA